MLKKSILQGFKPKIKNNVQDTYQGQNGLLYKFIATFENGDTGECNSTSTSPKWEIGKEYNYELESRTVNGNTYFSIKGLKKVDFVPNYNGGSSYTAKTPAEWESHAMQVAIESVAWMYLNTGQDPKHRDICIKKVYQWIESVVQGNDKLYWRAFSVIKSAINFFISPQTDIKDFNNMLLFANTLFAMCDVEPPKDNYMSQQDQPIRQMQSMPEPSIMPDPSISKTPQYPIEDDNEDLPF